MRLKSPHIAACFDCITQNIHLSLYHKIVNTGLYIKLGIAIFYLWPDMFIKVFHFLSLFAYLNLITYEGGDTSIPTKFAGDSVLEFVLDDVFDIPMDNLVSDIEIPNESYRLFNTVIHIIPAVLLMLSFFLFKQIGRIIVVAHPFYKTKSVCLPSYYSHLFRLKPF